ncbi:hypothetical protein [Streptomyces chartreusis]
MPPIRPPRPRTWPTGSRCCRALVLNHNSNTSAELLAKTAEELLSA